MLIAGIDPGVNTGIAVWDTASRQLVAVTCTGIVKAFRFLEDYRISRLYFEDARMRKWIPRERHIRQFKGRAMGAGSVKRDCSIWQEWCEVNGIEYVAVPPKNNTTKLSDAMFRGITGYDGRTNEHGRDAAMLVFGI